VTFGLMIYNNVLVGKTPLLLLSKKTNAIGYQIFGWLAF
jgi:hypothetical protein